MTHIFFRVFVLIFGALPAVALAVDRSSGAYQTGSLIGRIFGIVLLILIVRWIIQKFRK